VQEVRCPSPPVADNSLLVLTVRPR
jgi:hypothetical protein